MPATQMQSHIIKRPLSPGQLVAGGDARTRCPSGQGSSRGSDSSRFVQSFSSHVLRPSRQDFFFPEDFRKIAPAFQCMFQRELHGVPEPGGSEPGIMHDCQGMPGLDEGRRASRGAVRDRLPPAAGDASGTQTEPKPSQRRQHIAASQTMLTANTHAAHCYLYRMPRRKKICYIRGELSPRQRDGDGGRRGRRGLPAAGLLPPSPRPCCRREFRPLRSMVRERRPRQTRRCRFLGIPAARGRQGEADAEVWRVWRCTGCLRQGERPSDGESSLGAAGFVPQQ